MKFFIKKLNLKRHGYNWCLFVKWDDGDIQILNYNLKYYFILNQMKILKPDRSFLIKKPGWCQGGFEYRNLLGDIKVE